MEKLYEVAKHNIMFNGIAYTDFIKMFDCIGADIRAYKKNEIILLAGENVSSTGIVLSGSVAIISEDISGNSSIIAKLGSSEIFAETLVCAGILLSPVTVEAAEDCKILFLDYRKVITLCNSTCVFHAKLVENMLSLLAHKNLSLSQKNNVLSKRSTREKLICFLDSQRGKSRDFELSFNREEMARYLCVDRSAMSNELSKMKKEGLIDYDKNKFKVLY